MAGIPIKPLVGLVAATGLGAGLLLSRVIKSDVSGPRSVAGEHSIAAGHDEKKLGSDHCDCLPLWQCMSAKCNGEACSACAPLEQQLAACMAKSAAPKTWG